ncbi:hypothetical protein AArcMg_0589 [Natrarchaeobaculum sulfurireducens]|uniref:Uncharacterized protein n=1 Tax=Natrarchaeobaculum sulfurireducens TaxID=2044521 RepID=A0A346PBQ0_9EURY|nr:hypothetical protein AArc1_0601 [Natrarchaeobaculum sulfurireducens]AXR80612.1 hypothetical protein AArcMg_0589 [Natrarchaeobaculum sulfurireducens]
MTPQLTTPDLRDTTDTASTYPFPYGGSHSGVAIPHHRCRGVLRSVDGDGPIGAAGTLECPVCHGETTSGAGLFACVDCSWTGTLR